MPLRNTPERYGSVAQALHWVVVLLLIGQVTVGMIAHEMPDGFDKLVLLARHKSVGITILALAALRLAWRLIDRPPPPPPMPRWQRLAARSTHAAFYVLLFAMPLTGWAMSSASNYPVSWFGLVQLPDFVAPDRELKHLMEDVHETLAKALIALAVLHAAAALKHQFVDRDGLLWRMLPRRGR
ncbi:MAG: cytochrome b [Gammaproteobacteria bacterium]